MLLVPPTAMDINLNFMHRCQIMPDGGVGHHFHNSTEEMFIVFDGQAEFTVDGRTSVLSGTVGAPVRMGHSHAIHGHEDWYGIFGRADASVFKVEGVIVAFDGGDVDVHEFDRLVVRVVEAR
jgi:oxalate decarboxylase/phosphoglucose isomerase-like protein (cupin superfamily)